MKLNLGSGGLNIEGYVNLDLETSCEPDVIARVPPLPFDDGTFEEIVASHFMEHLTRPDAIEAVKECYRCLQPDGTLLVAVPDTREIMRGYIERVQRPGPPGIVDYYNADHTDLDVLCHLYLYSTVQYSHHLWSYDEDTLIRLVAVGGFEWACVQPSRHWWEVVVACVKEPSVEPALPFQRLLRKSCHARPEQRPVAEAVPRTRRAEQENGDGRPQDREAARRWLQRR